MLILALSTRILRKDPVLLLPLLRSGSSGRRDFPSERQGEVCARRERAAPSRAKE